MNSRLDSQRYCRHRETMQTKTLNHRTLQDEWPATLKAYVTTSCCRELCLDRAVPGWVRERAVLLGHDVTQKMTPKKQHEVCHSKCSAIDAVFSPYYHTAMYT